jgi:hypothetical protein
MTDQVRPLGDSGEHLELIRGMARANGVDLAEAQAAGQLEAGEWTEAVDRCRGCAWGGCRRWLETCDWGEAEAPALCINQDLMARLRQA